MPSIREGLSRSLMEAMASGVPCVVSKIRGNSDLISNNVNGFLCSNVDDYASSVKEILDSPEKAKSFAEMSLEIIREFSMEKVIDCIFSIYSEELG